MSRTECSYILSMAKRRSRLWIGNFESCLAWDMPLLYCSNIIEMPTVSHLVYPILDALNSNENHEIFPAAHSFLLTPNSTAAKPQSSPWL